MNHIKTTSTQNLAKVSVKRIRRFLEALVNLEGVIPGVKTSAAYLFSDDVSADRSSWSPALEQQITKVFKTIEDSAARLQQQYPELMPPPMLSRTDSTQCNQSAEILFLCMMVRDIWQQQDWRTRQYMAFSLWHHVLASQDSRLFQFGYFPVYLPPPTPFELAMKYLLDAVDFTRYCANGGTCRNPYFFATRRSQKYCSDLCAKPAQREHKRQWWAEHGSEWRSVRQEKSRNAKDRASQKRKGKP